MILNLLKKILVCLDGEQHSQRAQEYALALAKATGAHLTALHVENPYLKQFHHEIYAAGRREYVAYVDNLLRDLAGKTLAEFSQTAAVQGIAHAIKSRHGNPLDEIVKETEENNYDLVVVGGKYLRGLERLKSENLPNKLEKVLKTALLIVKQQ